MVKKHNKLTKHQRPCSEKGKEGGELIIRLLFVKSMVLKRVKKVSKWVRQGFASWEREVEGD